MRSFGRQLLVPFLSASALVVVTAAHAAASATAIGPLETLRIWEGRWKVDVQVKETPYSHAATVAWNASCAWQPHGAYMICDYLSDGVDAEAGKVANNLSIFYYSDADKAIKHTGMGTEGGPREQIATVDGNVWTTTFEVTGHKGQKIECRNVYNFVSPDKHLDRFEVSDDNGAHWTVVKEGVSTKVE